MAAENLLNVRLLGVPTIMWGDQTLSIQRRMARVFIYYLASHASMVSRSELVVLFWPDSPNSRQQLRDLLSKLRAELPDPEIIQTDRDWVGLDYSKVNSDVLIFENLYEELSLPFLNIEGRPVPEAIYQKMLNAVNMWAAPAFLYGVSFMEKEELNDWVVNKNKRLRFKWLNLMMRIAQHLMVVGDLESANSWLEKVNENDENYEFPQVIYNRLDVLYQLGKLSQAYEYGMEYAEEIKTNWFSEYRLPFEALMKKIENERLQVAIRIQPPARSARGKNIPLMGRNDLISQIQRAYRRGDIIVLTGETGYGKSRIFDEFTKNLNTSIPTYTIEPVYSERHIAFHALIERLRHSMNVQDWQKIEKFWVSQLSPLMPELQSHLDKKSEYYSLIENRQLGLFEAFRQVFLTFGGNQKILINVENAQWLDEETVHLFEYLTQRNFFNEKAQLFLLLSNNEQNLPLQTYLQNPAWISQIAKIDIPPLSLEDISNITLYLLRNPLSEEQTQQLMDATGGNPLFVIETLQMILEKPEMLSQKTWDSIPLSGVVRIVIRERLGLLSEISQKVLTSAALVGITFNLDYIHAMSDLYEDVLVFAIDELINNGMIEINSRKFQTLEYRFTQTFVREVVLQSISQTQKQILHKRLANYLLVTPHDRKTAEDNAVIGYHLGEAGKIEEAFQYWIEAAELYKNANDYQKADHAYEQAYLLFQNIRMDFSDQNLFNLWVGWGDLKTRMNDLKTATEYYQKAMEEGLFRKSSLLIGSGLSGEGYLYLLRGFPNQAMQYLDRAIIHLKDGYLEEYIRAGVRKMLTHLYHFDLNASMAEFESFAHLKNQLKTEKEFIVFASLQSTIALTYMLAGRFQEAETQANQAIQTALKYKISSIRVECEFNLGLGYYYQGMYQKALEKFGLALLIAKSNYYWRFALETLTVNSRVHLALGKTYQCLENIQNAYTLANMNQYTGMHCLLTNAEGRLFVAFGNYKKALDFFNQSIKFSNMNRNQLLDHMWIGFCYCMQGDLENGVQQLKLVVQDAEKDQLIQLKLEAEGRLGLALYMKGEIDEALELLKNVTEQTSKIGFAAAGTAFAFVRAQHALKNNEYEIAIDMGKQIMEKAKQEESPWLEWIALDIWLAANQSMGKTCKKCVVQKHSLIRNLNQSKPQNSDFTLDENTTPYFALV